MNSNVLSSRRFTLALAGLVALASTVVVLAISGTNETHAAGGHDHHGLTASEQNNKQLAFHDAMRALWETHGSWTHMVIVSFVGNDPNLTAEEQILLQNQIEIGNAVKPYYGTAAGDQLTKLLKAHILGAVTVLEAAKSANKARLAQAEAAWSENGQEVADFLHAADPRFLSLETARTMMRIHLEQVIEQAVDELKGNYAASVAAYEPYIRHILVMADLISGGIIKQFPNRFR